MESGKYVDGRYKIKHILGSGGMANVFLANDLILERDVAIKVLRYDFKDDQAAIRRFRREVTASTELVHPNIVPIYDIGGDDYPYLVMKYVDGPNLMDYINANHPLAYQRTIDIMQEILSGVAYAHSKGVIHRDLKPQNILMSENQHAMITDFGIAVALRQQSITQTNSVLGSVQYIAPEQAKGSMASRQSDIYSLGIILYQMLSNELPFDGESAVSIALKHFQEPMPSLKEIDDNIPQALENVVLKATAKDPRQRYQTAQEMSDDLQTALDIGRYGESKFVEQTHDLNHVDTIYIPHVSDEMKATEKSESQLADDTESDQAKRAEDENEKKQPKKKKRNWVVPVVIIFMIAALLASFYFLTPKDIVIPDLEGMTVADAQAYIEERNLELSEIIDEASEEYEEGVVIRTNPKVGNTVKEGSAINLYVSTGKPFVKFPDVRGEKFEEIRAKLTDQGFTVESIDEESDQIPIGEVIRQDIPVNKEVRPDETIVTLTVSTGPPSFSLRDLTQYSWKDVQEYADEMKIKLEKSEEHSDTVEKGQVISQSPKQNANLKAGDTVSVVVSSGPKEEDTLDDFTVNVTIPYVATDDDEEDEEGKLQENEVTIYLKDVKHTYDSPYRSLRISSDTTIQLPFTLKKNQTGSYRIERDGEVIEESEVSN